MSSKKWNDPQLDAAQFTIGTAYWERSLHGLRGCARVVVEKHPRSLIRTYQTSRLKAGMTSHPKRPRDDLYSSRLQPSQLAALDGWIANQDASLTSGLPNLEKAK